MGKTASMISGAAMVMLSCAALYNLATTWHDFSIANIFLIASCGSLGVVVGLLIIIASIFGIELSKEEKRLVIAS